MFPWGFERVGGGTMGEGGTTWMSVSEPLLCWRTGSLGDAKGSTLSDPDMVKGGLDDGREKKLHLCTKAKYYQ
jgi:hypothetical protein